MRGLTKVTQDVKKMKRITLPQFIEIFPCEKLQGYVHLHTKLKKLPWSLLFSHSWWSLTQRRAQNLANKNRTGCLKVYSEDNHWAHKRENLVSKLRGYLKPETHQYEKLTATAQRQWQEVIHNMIKTKKEKKTENQKSDIRFLENKIQGPLSAKESIFI